MLFKLFTKAGQIARHLRTDSSTAARQILSIELFIEVTGIQIFRYDFRPMLIYLYGVSFLTTLDIYKDYFRGRQIREYKENICKR